MSKQISHRISLAIKRFRAVGKLNEYFLYFPSNSWVNPLHLSLTVSLLYLRSSGTTLLQYDVQVWC